MLVLCILSESQKELVGEVKQPRQVFTDEARGCVVDEFQQRRHSKGVRLMRINIEILVHELHGAA